MEDLAAASSIPIDVVKQFENGHLTGPTPEANAMRSVFEQAGIGFVFADGVVACGITFASPRADRVTH